MNTPNLGLLKAGGVYALMFRLDKSATITVGAQGTFDFAKGHYLYVGSAHGAGGLRSRVGRHTRRLGGLGFLKKTNRDIPQSSYDLRPTPEQKARALQQLKATKSLQEHLPALLTV